MVQINDAYGRKQAPSLRANPELDEKITEMLTDFPIPDNIDEVTT